jgi:hypothetical protein
MKRLRKKISPLKIRFFHCGEYGDKTRRPHYFPLMDNVHISTHFFFVPNRLVWNNWERFNGEQDNPGDSTDYNNQQT